MSDLLPASASPWLAMLHDHGYQKGCIQRMWRWMDGEGPERIRGLEESTRLGGVTEILDSDPVSYRAAVLKLGYETLIAPHLIGFPAEALFVVHLLDMVLRTRGVDFWLVRYKPKARKSLREAFKRELALTAWALRFVFSFDEKFVSRVLGYGSHLPLVLRPIRDTLRREVGYAEILVGAIEAALEDDVKLLRRPPGARTLVSTGRWGLATERDANAARAALRRLLDRLDEEIAPGVAVTITVRVEPRPGLLSLQEAREGRLSRRERRPPLLARRPETAEPRDVDEDPFWD